MKNEIKLNRISINDCLSANALSVGFKGRRSLDQIKERLEKLLREYPLTRSKIVIENGTPFFEEMDSPYVNIVQVKESDKVWITNQYKIPLKIEKGELIRFALVGENNLVIYYNSLLSDSRGIVNFAKVLLSTQDIEESSFYFPEIIDSKLSLMDRRKQKSLIKSKKETVEDIEIYTKLKSVSLKSDIIYRICSGEKVTMLSFFIITALSLKKTARKKIYIPYCRKENYEDVLINDSIIFDFKRGFEPRLSFYENAGEIDKLLESIIRKKSYGKRENIMKGLPFEYLENPKERKKIYDFLSGDLQFDILPTCNEDEVINTLNFYPSSSFVNNNFGISAVDDRITISTVIHNKESEEFFSDFSKTINLLSKEATRRFKNL